MTCTAETIDEMEAGARKVAPELDSGPSAGVRGTHVPNGRSECAPAGPSLQGRFWRDARAADVPWSILGPQPLSHEEIPHGLDRCAPRTGGGHCRRTRRADAALPG